MLRDPVVWVVTSHRRTVPCIDCSAIFFSSPRSTCWSPLPGAVTSEPLFVSYSRVYEFCLVNFINSYIFFSIHWFWKRCDLHANIRNAYCTIWCLLENYIFVQCGRSWTISAIFLARPWLLSHLITRCWNGHLSLFVSRTNLLINSYAFSAFCNSNGLHLPWILSFLLCARSFFLVCRSILKKLENEQNHSHWAQITILIWFRMPPYLWHNLPFQNQTNRDQHKPNLTNCVSYYMKIAYRTI